jgi:hypothetical protein
MAMGRGKHASLVISDLMSDDAYQRGIIRQQKLKEMLASWNWPACGTLSVARRKNGSFYVIDGQGRAKVIREKFGDKAQADCMVWEIQDARIEALIFLLIQKRENIAALDKYRVELLAGNPRAMFVDKVLAESGVELAYASGPRKLACVDLLMNWASNVPDEMERLMPMIGNWSREGGLIRNFLVSLMYIERRMYEGKSLTDPRWRNRLNELGPAALQAAANRPKLLGGPHNSAREWANSVLDVMNKGLRRKLRIRATLTEDDLNEEEAD